MIEQIRDALRPITMAPESEAVLQVQIADCLERAGIAYQREFPTKTGPVDFVIGRTAVEVKVQGSALQVARQMIRYLQDVRFTDAILITTRAVQMPITYVVTVDGQKPVRVIELWRQFL